MIEKIKIRGARVHNLKNIDVDVPLNKIVAIGDTLVTPLRIFNNKQKIKSSTRKVPGAT